jgi:hypothetical protein
MVALERKQRKCDEAGGCTGDVGKRTKEKRKREKSLYKLLRCAKKRAQACCNVVLCLA